MRGIGPVAASAALRDELQRNDKLPFEALESFPFRANFRQSLFQKLPDLVAALASGTTSIACTDNLANFLKTHSSLGQHENGLQPAYMLGKILACASRRTSGFDQPHSLVESQRRFGNAQFARHLADFQRPIRLALHPIRSMALRMTVLLPISGS